MSEHEVTIHKLITLLKEASNEMIEMGDRDTFTSYNTCKNLGYKIKEMALALEEKREIDVNELWGIFAPTSDWDDSGGSNDLADEINELTKKLFGDILF